MGGAARNHGGTRGHGCSPLPGERPNFNHHTLSDNQLLGIIKSSKTTEKQTSDQKVKLVQSPYDPKKDKSKETSKMEQSQPVYRKTFPSKSSSNLSSMTDSKDKAKEDIAMKDNKSSKKTYKPEPTGEILKEINDKPPKEINNKAEKRVQQVDKKTPKIKNRKLTPQVESQHDQEEDVKYNLEHLQMIQSKKVNQLHDTRDIDDKVPAVMDNSPMKQRTSKQVERKQVEWDNKPSVNQQVEDQAIQPVDNKYPQDGASGNTCMFKMPLPVTTVHSQLLQMMPFSIYLPFSSAQLPMFQLDPNLLTSYPLQAPVSPFPLPVFANSQNYSVTTSMWRSNEDMLRSHEVAKD